MKKKLSRILISRILSYFPHKKLHLIVVYSKVLQKYLEIPFENFKFYSSFRNNIYYQENMSSYYEFYLYNYPNIKKEIIKTALLEYLIIYSSNNKYDNKIKVIYNGYDENDFELMDIPENNQNNDFSIFD